jgi:hypothetical protein
MGTSVSPCAQVILVKNVDDTLVNGRGSHSSTFQLNLSRF